MSSIKVALPLWFMLSILTGCSEQSSQDQKPIKAAESNELQGELATAIAPDIRANWQWSAVEVRELTTRAKNGDMEAADRLYQYYSVHEDRAKIAYWEDWLFKRGDPSMTRLRAERLYLTARKRPNDDPRKLFELQEAERLYLLALPPENLRGYLLDDIRSEIATIAKSAAVMAPSAKSRN